MNENQNITRGFRPKRLSWLTIVLALLAIITFAMISRPNYQYIMPMGIVGGIMEEFGSSESVPPMTGMTRDVDYGVSYKEMPDSRDIYYPYPNPNPNVPITDTREFLKVYYNANMHTRNVQGLVGRVETVVRGYDGRVDEQSSSEKYGYVSFAIPQSKYDAVRTELEGLVNSRFLITNISSHNLLSQKVSIEEQQKQADKMLSDYKTERQRIVNVHTNDVKSLQSKIDTKTQELGILRAETSTPQILIQIQSLSDELSSLKQQLVKENSLYTTQLNNMDVSIKNTQDWQKAIQTQDKILLDNVATVTGTISIQWISLWDTIRVYLPGYWIPTIFAVLSFISFLSDRRRFGVL